MKSVYSAVRTGSLNKAVCASSVKGLILKYLLCEIRTQGLPLKRCGLLLGTKQVTGPKTLQAVWWLWWWW